MKRRKQSVTPGGIRLQQMSMPPRGTRRNIFSSAAQLTFDNRENKMTDAATNAMASAIVQQQATRTPAPVPKIAESRTKNVLTVQQTSMLIGWMQANTLALIGKSLSEAAVTFNMNVAAKEPIFAGSSGKARGVTTNNMYGVLKNAGLTVAGYRIVAADPTLFKSVAPAPTVPAPVLPAGVEAVTMYRGDDGKLYETAEEAAGSNETYRLAEFLDKHLYFDGNSMEVAKGLMLEYHIIKRPV